MWDSVIQIMGEPISQASVIKFLQGMTEKDILEEERRAGKGGYHGVYYQKYTGSEFKQYLAMHFIRKLLKELPSETGKVIDAL